jgi:hypothetical protein
VTPLPRSPRVFYGWIVLAASVAVIAVGTGTISSLAVFLRSPPRGGVRLGLLHEYYQAAA